MKKLFVLLLLLGATILQAQTTSIKATNEMTAREIIEKNAYIEFTRGENIGLKFPFIIHESGTVFIDSDSLDMANVAEPSINEWHLAIGKFYGCSKMRAAHYRFYKTLSLDEEKRLVTTAKSAADLNISEELFKRFMKEINRRNETLPGIKADYDAKGIEIYFEKDERLKTFLEEPIDYLKVELKDKGLTTQEMVEKNVFIGYTVEELKTLSHESKLNAEHPAQRAARYRFYKRVKENEEGLYYWDVKSGAELNISEDLFNHYTKDLEWVNEGIKRSIERGDTPISKPKFDVNYLNNLLNDNHSRYILRNINSLKYYPTHNAVNAK